MANREEKQAYIDEIAKKRGYVLDYHKVITGHDFEILQATNNIVSVAYSRSGIWIARLRACAYRLAAFHIY